MINKEPRNDRRKRRQLRGRKKIVGSGERPRLSVFRSHHNLSVQVIDDVRRRTLLSASTLEPAIKKEIERLPKVEAAKRIGEIIAERALGRGIKTIVFDRAGYPFHGKVKAVAEAARQKGLVF